MIEVEQLEVAFQVGGSLFRAAKLTVVQDVTLSIARGEVLGLVGESGSGKTTIGRAILRLIEPTGGRIVLDGVDITHLDRAALRPMRRRMQMIFQDPYSSLDPRMTVERIVGEAYEIHGIGTARDRKGRVEAMLHKVGLGKEALQRYPHEFSGGQRQRIGIARALAAGPDYVVADEPVSALDVSVQAQVVNLLKALQAESGLGMLFIAHDLAVVQHVSDRVAVLYLGRLMEVAPSRALYAAPRHPYTAALIEAAPVPDPALRGTRRLLQGEIPGPESPPSGCVFRTRCPYAIDACSQVVPVLIEVAPGHLKACIRDDILVPVQGRKNMAMKAGL